MLPPATIPIPEIRAKDRSRKHGFSFPVLYFAWKVQDKIALIYWGNYKGKFSKMQILAGIWQGQTKFPHVYEEKIHHGTLQISIFLFFAHHQHLWNSL